MRRVPPVSYGVSSARSHPSSHPSVSIEQSRSFSRISGYAHVSLTNHISILLSVGFVKELWQASVPLVNANDIIVFAWVGEFCDTSHK